MRKLTTLAVLAAAGIAGAVVVARLLSGGQPPPVAAVQPQKAPAAIDVGDGSTVVGLRGGNVVAMIDLVETAPALANLPEDEIDRLVRSLVSRKVAGWLGDERYRHAGEVSTDVITIVKRDEYQRPDMKSALRHGRLRTKVAGGRPAALEGSLSFAGLRALRSQFPPPARGDAAAKPAATRRVLTRPVPRITADQLAKAREEIQLDEVDLWHRPRTLSNVYPAFEALRVRTKGGEYYFRNSAAPNAAASGRRFGELVLTEPSASLLYLPQRLDFTGTLGYALAVRKSDPKLRLKLRIYASYEEVATVEEGKSEGFPLITDTAWQHVKVPLSSFRFEIVERRIADKPTWKTWEDFLSRHPVVPGYVFGIEIVADGPPGATVRFDRLAVLRQDTGQLPGLISGRLDPPLDGAVVHVRAAGFETSLKAEADGRFQLKLPDHVQRIEIFAEADDRLYAPRFGRFLEIGPQTPLVEIQMSEERGSSYPVGDGISSAIYDYGEKYGAHIRPGHFGVGLKPRSDVVLFLEQRANRHGFIDRDRRFENPDKAYRVVVIGDSYYMALYNDMRDAFWNQAEALLNLQQDRPVEVISATHHHGAFVTGWSHFKEYALKFKPDLVILPVIHPEILNFGMPEYVQQWLGIGPGHPPGTAFALDGAGRLVVTPHDPNWRQTAPAMPDDQRKAIRQRIDTRQYIRRDIENAPKWVHDNLRTLSLAFRTFVEAARKDGVEVALGYSAYEADMALGLTSDASISVDPALLRDRMRKLAESSGLTFLDLSAEIYAKAPNHRHYYIQYDGHWSSYGHYRAGTALASEIRRRLDKPRRTP